MRLVTTFIQNTESTDPDLSYLNRARFVLSVADGHGSDGVGILDAVIRNRHLFLSMTSGAEIDAGSVFTEDDLPVASDSRLGIAAFDPAYFSILAGKVSLRGDLDFGLNETQLAEYLTANKYATQAWVAAQGFIGSDGLALYATKEWVLGQNFAKASSLGNYLLKSVWDEVFEVTTVNGVQVLNVKLDIVGLKGISAYGLGSTSGGSASGSLGELVNVGQWADEVPTADRVMVQLAGATHWSAKPLADLVGLDTAALAQYLTANSYLKASDISSYLTWANLSGKPTVYPTSWANIADKPTVYPTTWTSVTGRPTKLSDLTDDVVAGNYLPKPTWDAVFEVVTVDGTPALKVKYDILGLKGITAYADGTLSGGFSGALVDLVDVAVTNLASGDILKYNGTHFVNVPVSSIAGASSWDQITGKPEYYPTRWANVSGAPTSLPASDVYPWAKAASKPTYTAAEVGALALSGGTLTGNVITIGSFILANSGAYPQLTFRATADNSERLLFRHGNDLKWRYNGTNDGIIYHSGNFNPSSKLDKSVWDEAFEIKTVDGVRVISAKLDFLSVAGISAYATGPSSGGGGGGLDYDLLKQALTGAITPDGYPFTISASFLGAIDKTYLTGKLANTYANKVHTHLWTDITDRPTALPANGGNADTVDNLHASSFAQIKSYNFPSGGVNNITDLDFTGNIQAHFPGAEYSCIWQGKDFAGTILQLKLRDYAGKQSMMYRGSLTKTWRTVWDSGIFNPDSKFNNLGQTNDSNNVVGNGYTLKELGGTFSGPFLKWGIPGHMFEFFSGNRINEIQIRHMSQGVWGNPVIMYHSGNFNPANYLPLSGGSITGGLGVSGYLTAGVLKINETGSVYPQILFTGNNGNSSLLFVNAISRELVFRPADGVANDGIVYHSKNLTKLSQLTNDVVPSWALATTNHYLPYDDTRNTNYAPYNSNISKGLTTVHLKTTGIDGLADGGNFHSSIYITPWMDASGGHAHNIAFTDNGNMWMRHGTASWSEWVKVYHSGNSNLSTVDWAAKNITAAGTIVSMSTVESRGNNSTGILPQMLWHLPNVSYTRIRMNSNGTLHVIDGGTENYKSLYAQSFVAAGNVTAADTVTATKLVLGGITIDVYNGALRVNGNLVATGGVTSLATA